MDDPAITDSRKLFMGGFVPRSELSEEESIEILDAENRLTAKKARIDHNLQLYLEGKIELPEAGWDIDKTQEFLKEAFRPKMKVGILFLKELDELLRPHLLAWCRLVFPMGYRSLRGDYWVVPQGMIKIHLKSGATWHLGVKSHWRRKPQLFLRGISPLHWWIGHTGEYYEQATRSLKAWCLAQQNAPAVEEPFFHKPVEEMVQLFYYVMFSGFTLGGDNGYANEYP